MLSFRSFTIFYDDNKEIVDREYNIIKEHNKDKCNRKNDLLYYFDNYHMKDYKYLPN